MIKIKVRKGVVKIVKRGPHMEVAAEAVFLICKLLQSFNTDDRYIILEAVKEFKDEPL